MESDETIRQSGDDWTNAMTGPLPESIGQQLMRAAADQVTADQVAKWFEDPTKAYHAFFEACYCYAAE